MKTFAAWTNTVATDAIGKSFRYDPKNTAAPVSTVLSYDQESDCYTVEHCGLPEVMSGSFVRLSVEDNNNNNTSPETPTGTFVFRVRAASGETGDIRIPAGFWQSPAATTSQVSTLHTAGRDLLQGEPFEVLSRSWEDS
jgi:hypothetical protein